MNENTIPSKAASEYKVKNLLERFSKNALLSVLGQISRGAIILQDGEDIHRFGNKEDGFEIQGKIYVHSPRFYPMIVFNGDIGAGEAYMDGLWSSDNLPDVIRVLALNPDALNKMNGGMGAIAQLFQKLLHIANRNTVNGSRRNISAHYDLGNDFFSLILDPTMAYSCAVFEKPEMTLEEASVEKFDRICRKLNLKENDELIEIGTGWGGFALHAAEKYGCHVTTTTISKRQYEHAKKLVDERGMGERISVLNNDYRDQKGKFDKLVSIEMIEAIGYEYLNTFMGKCSSLLKPDGMMALQAITMLDSRFDHHKDSVDFIKKYIFPGSCVLSVSSICNSAAETTDLRLLHLEDIGLHYQRTLNTWRVNLFNNIDNIWKLGYPEEFIRMWDFYLSYCEGSFGERYISDAQFVFGMPCCREKVRF